MFGATPTPVPPALSEADTQLLQLTHDLNASVLTNTHTLLLYLCLKLPIPVDWKLNLYHFLISLPFPEITRGHLVFLIIFGPMVILLIGYILIRLLIYFFQFTFPMILAKFSKETKDKVFLELTFPSDTSKSAYATEQVYRLFHTLSRRRQGIFSLKQSYSLEIVATREKGIRYVLVVPRSDADVIHRSLLSYLPGLKIQENKDYFPDVSPKSKKKADEDETVEKEKIDRMLGVCEFTLSRDFVLPLNDLKVLKEHDPISFLTANMTKLAKGEMIAFQLVTNPHLAGSMETRIQDVKNTIYRGRPLTPVLQKKGLLPSLPPLLLLILSPTIWVVVTFVKLIVHVPYLVLSPNGPESKAYFRSGQKVPLQELLNPYEQEISTAVKNKLSQPLFEASIRVFIMTNTEEEFDRRESGLVSSFGQFTSEYQALTQKGITRIPYFSTKGFWKRIENFRNRALSTNNAILSSSEISDLYHFPNMDLSRVEGVVKSKSQELPAPLSLKDEDIMLEVVVGTNTYGGEETRVGLLERDRRQHTYIIGKTGMGKSTIIEGMALQDIQNGKGVAVLDPHGDMIEHMLTLIPPERRKDIVYVDPYDKAYPIGLNILAPGINLEDKDEEHDRITSEVLAIFMKITPEKHWGQRMEHVLRNATLTALQIPTGTQDTPYVSLYTIQKLLTNENYRKSVTKQLQDPILKQYWDKEFKLFGTGQQADMISPLTNKIGEFITNKLSRNILLQEKSTINVSEIMNNGKILLVKLSKGNLGEERSKFFGTLITSLIQLGVYQRAQIKERDRKDFFVYIDEFQNFATPHFTDLFSEARKYHVFFIPSHQNVAQIEDAKVSKIIQGNSGNIIALKGSPDDEKVLLPFLSPEVEKGQIVNLAPHHFFMKVTNPDSEDAFTGITIPITAKGKESTKETIIEYSRVHYATSREAVDSALTKLLEPTNIVVKLPKNVPRQTKKTNLKNGVKDTRSYVKEQAV